MASLPVPALKPYQNPKKKFNQKETNENIELVSVIFL